MKPEPKEHFNIDQLSQLAPNLYRLETIHGYIMFREDLADFVLKIIRQFRHLVYLTLNKATTNQSTREKKERFKEKLIAGGHGILFDAICIWL